MNLKVQELEKVKLNRPSNAKRNDSTHDIEAILQGECAFLESSMNKPKRNTLNHELNS